MTHDETVQILAYIENSWIGAREIDLQAKAAVWADVFEGASLSEVHAAVKRLAQGAGPSGYTGPSTSQVFDEMKKTATGSIPSWQECKGTIEASFYDGTAIRDAHPIVRLVSAAVGGPRSLAANSYGADARVKAAYWPIVERYERDTANELSGSPQIASAPRSAIGTRRGGEPAQIGISAPIRATHEDALD